MVLAVTPLLWALVAKQRPAVPKPFRAIVEQVVLERGAHGGRRAFRPQRQRFAVVVERVHLFFDDIGHFADAAHEELGLLDDGRANVAIAVLREHRAHGVFQLEPARGFAGQYVVHAAHGLDRPCHGVMCESGAKSAFLM